MTYLNAARAAIWDAGAAAREAAWDAAKESQTHNLLVNYGGLDPANFTRRTS